MMKYSAVITQTETVLFRPYATTERYVFESRYRWPCVAIAWLARVMMDGEITTVIEQF